MDRDSKKLILTSILCILTIAGVFCGMYMADSELNDTIGTLQNTVINEIKIIDEDVIAEDITENVELSSDENTIEEVTVKEEEELEAENIIKEETEGFELQGDISYDGDRAKTWDIEVGDYKGLTYYSQLDSRWKNKPYTVTGNSSQTIGSSGCGPTVAAMIVSSIRGEITPDEMAELFLKYGYRSANNGTYWSAYRAVADEFNIGYIETSNFEKAIELLRNNNYIIVSCGNGLFTTGGHYIVLVGVEENTLKIYDPYNYNGKFETSTRRGKVVVEGNTIYCSIENFKKYANYKNFFAYQDIEHSKFKTGEKVLVNTPVGIACYSGDYALVDDWSNQFWIHRSIITPDSRVYGLGTIAFDGGSTDIVQIFSEQFWCKEKNMSDIAPVVQAPIQNTVGQNRVISQSTIIYQNANLTGIQYNYKANTTVIILENVTADIDKVKVKSTGRTGYIKNKLYK